MSRLDAIEVMNLRDYEQSVSARCRAVNNSSVSTQELVPSRVVTNNLNYIILVS